MANITDIETHKDFISAYVNYYIKLNKNPYYFCGNRANTQDITCWFSASDFTYKSSSGDNYTFSHGRAIYFMYDDSTEKYSVGSTTQSLYISKDIKNFYTNSENIKEYIPYDKKDFLAVECSNNETECNIAVADNTYTIMLVYIVVFVLLANFFYKVVFR